MALAGHQSYFHYAQQRNFNGSALLYAEIKNYNSPNIATFLNCFEDEDNTALHRVLNPIVHATAHRRFQLHAHQAIHRDLRPEAWQPLNVNVGNFGIAAFIENSREEDDDPWDAELHYTGGLD
ncbi:hypothetical protein BKA70DRAFT_1426983 [Coprinopsis sp. MPI-PUGE-AT-0042]|nr:hypothetical protein BKA70DRAFT_1426983 [Coprinopsis sp. MPI-PUGE-AT-0042]